MAEVGADVLNNPTRQQLREFSKKKHDELAQHVWTPRCDFPRLATADRITTARKDIPQSKRRVASERWMTGESEKALEESREKVLSLEEKRSLLEQQLSDQRTQITKRIMAFFKPQMQAEMVEDLQNELTDISEGYERANRSRGYRKSEYERHLAELNEAEASETRARKRPQEILDEFYEQTLKLYQLDQKLQKDRQELEVYKEEQGGVEQIVQEHNIYFVHATAPQIRNGWGNNQFLRDGVDWQEKVACVLGKKPSLSVSSIKPGAPAHTWADMGLVLTGGRIDDAWSSDKGTQATKNGGRISSNPPRNIHDYNNRISWAVHSDKKNYNEYIVANPQAVGLFINLDGVRNKSHARVDEVDPNVVYQTTHFTSGKETVSYAEIFAAAEQFEMPVFVFDNGIAYESSLDPSTRSIIKGKEVTPQEMLERQYTTPETPLITEMSQKALRPEILV